jgi:hypothetical protein
MDTKDLVTETASKLNFDKHFVVGFVIGATAVGAVSLAALLKKKFDARNENDSEDAE